MTTSRHVRISALRDQLLAVLRDATVPVSTLWLAAAAMPITELIYQGSCVTLHDFIKPFGYRLASCDGNGEHRVVAPASPQNVYPHLLRLEALGLVERTLGPDHDELVRAAKSLGIHPPSRRQVYWRAIARDLDLREHELLAALETDLLNTNTEGQP
ncbi:MULTISPECIES: hypothetical protein [unclassified Mycobacteroides]|uniref:hypothetical protein n=1 Tax=unclassified Mycobacteroides TaxID=2618759 RepID=UPI000714262F|nr:MULTISPECIES: hypothetical protein [unclassified Mycobacteroides]KRQ20579.1 hypothetical protein AOT87_17720 [Mycobacteroides sp. H003]KRQ20973.1 hypothetical protein AOT91_26480 [Mycobacteroides sp. H092]KRQ35391.1 hypothetical protein AOT92_24140 [Mycobacteroides sp. H101]KRQ45665.1 hypothetical protein AOT88_19630 [Mycobacteroides sp. H063]KRQ55450.1 hypothetical protein AOT90_28055 [Mycobacteroides sp. H079]